MCGKWTFRPKSKNKAAGKSNDDARDQTRTKPHHLPEVVPRGAADVHVLWQVLQPAPLGLLFGLDYQPPLHPRSRLRKASSGQSRGGRTPCLLPPPYGDAWLTDDSAFYRRRRGQDGGGGQYPSLLLFSNHCGQNFCIAVVELYGRNSKTGNIAIFPFSQGIYSIGKYQLNWKL
jgi:hypothetical protein